MERARDTAKGDAHPKTKNKALRHDAALFKGFYEPTSDIPRFVKACVGYFSGVWKVLPTELEDRAQCAKSIGNHIIVAWNRLSRKTRAQCKARWAVMTQWERSEAVLHASQIQLNVAEHTCCNSVGPFGCFVLRLFVVVTVYTPKNNSCTGFDVVDLINIWDRS